VEGKILLSVHYYEQGNVRTGDRFKTLVVDLMQVQLAASHSISFELPSAVLSAQPAAAGSKILALIGEEEGQYQISLNETYQEMGEKTFKSLRRALPLTRQKLDWDKASGGITLRRFELKMCRSWATNLGPSCLGQRLHIRQQRRFSKCITHSTR